MTILRHRTAVRRILPCALAGLMYAAVTTACTTPLHAQSADLAAIDSLVAHSRFRDAAAALAKWERDNASRITPANCVPSSGPSGIGHTWCRTPGSGPCPGSRSSVCTRSNSFRTTANSRWPKAPVYS